MLIFKKIIFVFLVMGLLLFFWQGSLEIKRFLSGTANLAQAKDLGLANLQFSVEGGKIYFFQPSTSRVFVYQTSTNRFSHLLTLEKLGEELKQSRSYSAIEAQKKDN